jgi:hypothetical protein
MNFIEQRSIGTSFVGFKQMPMQQCFLCSVRHANELSTSLLARKAKRAIHQHFRISNHSAFSEMKSPERARPPVFVVATAASSVY